MAHARAKLTVLGRQLLVNRVEIDGWKPADAAKAMGVSRQTAYKWLRRFRDEGGAGLVDRTSAPRRCPHRLDADAVATIVATRLETLYGPHRLAYALDRPRSTIYGVLRREQVSRLSFIDRPTRTVVRYERERPGELLHVDVKKLGRIREGGGWKMHGREMGMTGEKKRNPVGYDYLHVAVDDNSRVAFVQTLKDEKAPTCAQFVRDAVAYFASEGVTIERVMTDNAAQLHPVDHLQKSPGRPRHRTSPHQALSAPDQWKGRTVQPNSARRVRLQDPLYVEWAADEGSWSLVGLIQCSQTSHGHRRAHPSAATSSTTLTGITGRVQGITAITR